MGLLDSVVGMLGAAQGGQAGAGGNADLLNAVVGMLANGSQQGGLGGLVQGFEQAGLGHLVSSWIGSGQNLPVSADQLSQVLGGAGGALGQLAQQTGLSHGDLAGQLSQMLPEVINHLTPSGQAPQGGLGDVASILGSLLTK
jgi:uncharacterized protein YidB (DUF937 family)